MTTPPDFGDVTGEYLALRSGAGLVPGSHDLVWVRGSDAARFLDGLLSRAIDRVPARRAARSLLLAPQGKLRATLWLLVNGEEEIGLVADPGCGAVVAQDLNRFRIRVDAEVVPDSSPIVSVWGPQAAKTLQRAGLPSPEPQHWATAGDAMVAHLPFIRTALPRYVVAGGDERLLIEAGATPAGTIAATTVRIEAGEPVMGLDMDEKTIPQEAGVVEGAVDFDKGCYLGQELVARIDSRGHVNRHLRGLVFTSNVLVPVGSEIEHDDRIVGTVSSIGESLELRAPVAMALVRREAEPGTPVTVRWNGGSTQARVAELPLDPGLGAS